MERIAPKPVPAAVADVTRRPQRRWSDGPNHPWTLAEEDWSVASHWPAVVAALCEQVARDTELIARDLARLDPATLQQQKAVHGIQGSVDELRAASMAMQQIVRLAAGGFQPVPEHVDLARLAKQVAHERLREFLRRNAEIGFDIRPADSMVDASVADSVLNVAIDWALSFSRRVRIKVENNGGLVRLVVRATLPTPSAPVGSRPRPERRMNDNLHWVLLRQLASCSQLPVARSSTAATESVVVQFPHAGIVPGAAAADARRRNA